MYRLCLQGSRAVWGDSIPEETLWTSSIQSVAWTPTSCLRAHNATAWQSIGSQSLIGCPCWTGFQVCNNNFCTQTFPFTLFYLHSQNNWFTDRGRSCFAQILNWSICSTIIDSTESLSLGPSGGSIKAMLHKHLCLHNTIIWRCHIKNRKILHGVKPFSQ